MSPRARILRVLLALLLALFALFMAPIWTSGGEGQLPSRATNLNSAGAR